jgi:hypothetical protein
MTLAEILLLIAGGTGIYFLLRPFQRWLERSLRRVLPGRDVRTIAPPPIDVTDFRSHRSSRKDDSQT